MKQQIRESTEVCLKGSKGTPKIQYNSLHGGETLTFSLGEKSSERKKGDAEPVRKRGKGYLETFDSYPKP